MKDYAETRKIINSLRYTRDEKVSELTKMGWDGNEIYHLLLGAEHRKPYQKWSDKNE